MRKLFVALALASVVSQAQADPVPCVKFGVWNGPVVWFQNVCPLGWTPA
jgi:hypothetical protein